MFVMSINQSLWPQPLSDLRMTGRVDVHSYEDLRYGRGVVRVDVGVHMAVAYRLQPRNGRAGWSFTAIYASAGAGWGAGRYQLVGVGGGG